MTNNSPNPSRKYYENERKNMLQFIPSTAKKILEVGCAEGKFSAMLVSPEREVWGVEMDDLSASIAQQKLDKLIHGDFDTAFSQLPKAYFDCVIFNDVLEHIYDPWTTINKVKQLLTPKGVLVSSIPNIRYISTFVLEIIGKKDFHYQDNGILDKTHVRFFTSKSIVRMFESCGYDILTHQGINPCKSWKEKLFINLTFGLFSDSRYKQFATVATPSQQ